VYIVFQVEARQYVCVFLMPLRIGLSREIKRVALVRMFGSDSGDHFQFVPRVFYHYVSGPYLFRCIVVERVADVAVWPRFQKQFVEIRPVFPVILGIAYSCRGVECIFIEETVPELVPVHPSRLEQEAGSVACDVESVRKVDVPSEIPVRVVLPSPVGGIGVVEVVAVEVDMGIVRSGAVCFREDPCPVEFQSVVFQERMLSLQRRVQDVLSVPFHPYGPFLVICSIPHFGLPEIHISCIEHHLVSAVEPVVELEMRPHPVLFL